MSWFVSDKDLKGAGVSRRDFDGALFGVCGVVFAGLCVLLSWLVY